MFAISTRLVKLNDAVNQLLNIIPSTALQPEQQQISTKTHRLVQLCSNKTIRLIESLYAWYAIDESKRQEITEVVKELYKAFATNRGFTTSLQSESDLMLNTMWLDTENSTSVTHSVCKKLNYEGRSMQEIKEKFLRAQRKKLLHLHDAIFAMHFAPIDVLQTALFDVPFIYAITHPTFLRLQNSQIPVCPPTLLPYFYAVRLHSNVTSEQHIHELYAKVMRNFGISNSGVKVQDFQRLEASTQAEKAKLRWTDINLSGLQKNVVNWQNQEHFGVSTAMLLAPPSFSRADVYSLLCKWLKQCPVDKTEWNGENYKPQNFHESNLFPLILVNSTKKLYRVYATRHKQIGYQFFAKTTTRPIEPGSYAAYFVYFYGPLIMSQLRRLTVELTGSTTTPSVITCKYAKTTSLSKNVTPDKTDHKKDNPLLRSIFSYDWREDFPTLPSSFAHTHTGQVDFGNTPESKMTYNLQAPYARYGSQYKGTQKNDKNGKIVSIRQEEDDSSPFIFDETISQFQNNVLDYNTPYTITSLNRRVSP